MKTIGISIASFLCLLPLGAGYSVITRVPVGLIDDHQSILLLSQLDRYTDVDKGLTAVKDSKLSSCYIKEYDPNWYPNIFDKEEIMKTNEPEIISSPEDEIRLRKKAGRFISEMCKPYEIYWATLPPPPMLPSGINMLPPPELIVPVDMKAPPTMPEPVDIHQLAEEIQDIIEEHDGNEIIESPRINNFQHSSSDIRTPPPLEIYQRLHQNQLNNPMVPRPPVDGFFPGPPVREIPGNLLIEPPVRGAPPMILDIPAGDPPKIPGEPPRIPQPPPVMIEVEREAMLEPPTPRMDNPEMKKPEVDDVDKLRTPPPLDVWRRMLVSIKGTVAPPLPDMRAPEYKLRK